MLALLSLQIVKYFVGFCLQVSGLNFQAQQV